ncbi:MAG TPA: hypothetical protein VH021_02295 [Trebonia sp.]|nr:hypothetical protein [Trebonia sp.]
MSVQDRVSTAAEATAASVREIRPLALPDSSAASAGPRVSRGRRPTWIRESWMIPLGAAALVAALALSLVTLRHAEAPGPAPSKAGTVPPAVAVAGVPRYYAVATEGPVSHAEMAAINVTVEEVRTGKTIAAVTLPAISELVGVNAAVGVSAAADDRTFVVGRRDEWGDVDYFLVRLAPGARQGATVERLPIQETAVGVLLGFAVSPDGKELAVLSVRGNGTTLRVYSVKSGATLRTWIAGTWHNQAIGALLPSVSWTADNRQVAFSTVVTTGPKPLDDVLVERRLGVTEPSGDLAMASKVVLKAPGSCSSLLLTPDGGTVVCATESNYGLNSSSASCGTNQPMFVAYSAATGRRLRVLYQYPGTCKSGVNTVLWSDDSARHVIGERQIASLGNPPRYTDQYGVATAGQFALFPVTLHGEWYSGPAF